MPSFRILRWAAWAPGLDDSARWLDWLAAPQALPAEGLAPLVEVPAMARRRVDPLGRAALQVAFQAQGADTGGPVVFASRWGEITRSVGMLQQLAAGEPLSPTAFSLSVHNAQGAQYSIARGDKANFLAVAAGAHSAEAGFVEALGLLADGAGQVTVVCSDGPLPAPYADLAEPPGLAPLRAWACLIQPGGELSLQTAAPGPTEDHAMLGDLAVLRFLLGSEPQLQRGRWRWLRASAAP
ncbi:MAG TPA: beta-ketoacyl synthase chain length factor [Ideonella sp.]|uniref:beta-ketoacyl synthase chain length factor n=1 Tax=Ideonella sp. TaxID=1929293 RepID=UPI002B790B96|nr:beta-ketoacyl synthase chain length factor [Ideonella sp.]HSI46658.1 beta-ketoacyl synthase chain length factor [Ideonella sp.]